MRKVRLQLGDDVKELVMIVQDSNQCRDPVAQRTRGFQEATTIVRQRGGMMP